MSLPQEVFVINDDITVEKPIDDYYAELDKRLQGLKSQLGSDADWMPSTYEKYMTGQHQVAGSLQRNVREYYNDFKLLRADTQVWRGKQHLAAHACCAHWPLPRHSLLGVQACNAPWLCCGTHADILRMQRLVHGVQGCPAGLRPGAVAALPHATTFALQYAWQPPSFARRSTTPCPTRCTVMSGMMCRQATPLGWRLMGRR